MRKEFGGHDEKARRRRRPARSAPDRRRPTTVASASDSLPDGRGAPSRWPPALRGHRSCPSSGMLGASSLRTGATSYLDLHGGLDGYARRPHHRAAAARPVGQPPRRHDLRGRRARGSTSTGARRLHRDANGLPDPRHHDAAAPAGRVDAVPADAARPLLRRPLRLRRPTPTAGLVPVPARARSSVRRSTTAGCGARRRSARRASAVPVSLRLAPVLPPARASPARDWRWCCPAREHLELDDRAAPDRRRPGRRARPETVLARRPHLRRRATALGRDRAAWPSIGGAAAALDASTIDRGLPASPRSTPPAAERSWPSSR